MNIYERLGLTPIINASDTYTIIGGSRMDRAVVDAMAEASEYFVDIVEFERKVSDRIAQITKNEACHICAGAAAGILLAAAGCMTGNDVKKAEMLPDSAAMKNEFLVFKEQLSGSITFLHMIETAGGKIVHTELNATSLEKAIHEKTAGIFYYPRIMSFTENFGLADITELAHRRNLPVIADVSPMLPPVSNLWYLTKELGADLAIFSGGKHIAGPQSTGLILGKESLVEACRINNGPGVRVGRPAKVGKEELAGILTAVERFVCADHAKLYKTYMGYLSRIDEGICGIKGVKTKIQPYGTLRQEYPLMLVTLPEGTDGNELHKELRSGTPSIDIRIWDKRNDTIFINPINLRPEELDPIIMRLRECLEK